MENRWLIMRELTRRDALIGAATFGAAMLGRGVKSAFAVASQPMTRITFNVPRGATDCHTHIIDPRRFPFAATRGYTPEAASVEEHRALHRALGTDRSVIVQPSFYGTDNRCTLDAVKSLGSSARCLVVVEDDISDAALNEMDRAGARGIRIFLGQTPADARKRLQTAARQVGNRKWHINTALQPSALEPLDAQIMATPVPIVFDHFAGAQASLGTQQAGFGILLNLLRMGKVYVKLSRIHNISTQAPDYPDVAPIAKALIAANPQRILWGTDWPHAGPGGVSNVKEITPLFQLDDGRVFNQLAAWAPDPAQCNTILVENPQRLYGF